MKEGFVDFATPQLTREDFASEVAILSIEKRYLALHLSNANKQIEDLKSQNESRSGLLAQRENQIQVLQDKIHELTAKK